MRIVVEVLWAGGIDPSVNQHWWDAADLRVPVPTLPQCSHCRRHSGFSGFKGEEAEGKRHLARASDYLIWNVLIPSATSVPLSHSDSCRGGGGIEASCLLITPSPFFADLETSQMGDGVSLDLRVLKVSLKQRCRKKADGAEHLFLWNLWNSFKNPGGHKDPETLFD